MPKEERLPTSEDKNQTNIAGGISTGSGDFVGRDSTVQGDSVDGNKIDADIVNIYESDHQRATVKLILDLDFNDFSEDDQEKLQTVINCLLRLKANTAIITNVERGSVIVYLELPVDEVKSLYWLYQAKELSILGLSDIDLADDTLDRTKLRWLGQIEEDADSSTLDLEEANSYQHRRRLMRLQRAFLRERNSLRATRSRPTRSRPTRSRPTRGKIRS